jgi:hypothetical protein
MQKQQINDYSQVPVGADLALFLEKRMENDGSGNPIYVGYNRQANAPTDALSWFIVKITYSGDSPTRYQLPTLGPQFKYAWDSRATYFA